MKKLAKGFYSGYHNGIYFEIHKVEVYDNKIYWYWIINNKPAEDWHTSKKMAIAAVKDYIDNP